MAEAEADTAALLSGGAEREGEEPVAPVTTVGTLDVDLILQKLLKFKENPGKQVNRQHDCMERDLATYTCSYIH